MSCAQFLHRRIPAKIMAMIRNILWMPQEPEIEINPGRIWRIAPGNVCKYTSLLAECVLLADEEIRSCTSSRFVGLVDPSV